MPAYDELVLDSRLDEIRKLGPWLIEALPQVGDDPAIAVLELVLVELVSNTIRHGHANEAGHTIRLRLERLGDRRVQVRIWDRGKPIPAEILNRSSDALEFAADDVEALPTSGLGLAMVQAAVDRIEYRTAPDGSNMTMIEKALEIEHPPSK
jgi:anti-sigma regulatory factor (Ser/Thr protein kinase)